MNLGKSSISGGMLLIGLAGVAAVLLLLWATPTGAGISPDSTTYLGAAKSLMRGKGFTLDGELVTHYPPLYPVFLAYMGILQSDLVQAARFLSAILFGTNAFLVGLAVYFSTRRNFLAALCASVFIVASNSLLTIHSWALSEPLFFAFSLISLILLALYVTGPSVPRLVASALAVGCAMLTRYIGVAFLPAGMALIFIGAGSLRSGPRIRLLLLWLTIACFPFVVFLLQNYFIAGTATNRVLFFHPLPFSSIAMLFVNWFGSFLPAQGGVLLAIAAVFSFLITGGLVLFAVGYFRKVDRRSIEFAMPVACILVAAFYMLVLLSTITFIDASTPLNQRILSPVFVFLIVGSFSATWALATSLKKPSIWFSFLVIVTLTAMLNMPDVVRFGIHNRQYGEGYSARQWQTSESMAFIRLLPENVGIYTNGRQVIRFLTGKDSTSVPVEYWTNTKKSNLRYPDQIAAMCKGILGGHAILAYFDAISPGPNSPTKNEIVTSCPLPILHRFKDGTVYGTIDWSNGP